MAQFHTMSFFAKGSIDNVSVPIVSNTSSPTAEVEEALGLNRWTSTRNFPFNGAGPQRCAAAQKCYTSGPHTYVELERIVARPQHVVTFMLRALPRMATPQPLVACDPSHFAVDYYPVSVSIVGNATFPLPPLTKVSTGYGDSQGITTYFCSGGTAADIESFMAKQLPASGWSPLMVNGNQLWKFNSSIGPIYMRIYPVTDPRKWSILTYDSGVNFG